MYIAQLHSWSDPSDAEISRFETLDELYEYLQENDLQMVNITRTEEDDETHLDERFIEYWDWDPEYGDFDVELDFDQDYDLRIQARDIRELAESYCDYDGYDTYDDEERDEFDDIPF